MRTSSKTNVLTAAMAILLAAIAGYSAAFAQQTQPPTADDQAPTAVQEPQKVVVLHGLDKITARISTIEIPIGESARFGTLKITARTCHKQPPEEPPETAAFLEIEEIRPGFEKVRLFTGWMFASSPALSALEHPVYDVWVTDCKTLTPDKDSGAE
jgi:hypothetical protein